MRKAVIGVLVAVLLASAPSAWAQGINNPHSVVFDVVCDLDDDGGKEAFLEVLTFLNATGTGRVVDSQQTLTLMGGTATGTFNGEVIFATEIPERPGNGLRTVLCDASARIVDEEGNFLELIITDAPSLLTPPGAPADQLLVHERLRVAVAVSVHGGK